MTAGLRICRLSQPVCAEPLQAGSAFRRIDDARPAETIVGQLLINHCIIHGSNVGPS